jgi:hypothetical protein
MKVTHIGGDEVLILILPRGTSRLALRQGIDLVNEARLLILERLHASITASELENRAVIR